MQTGAGAVLCHACHAVAPLDRLIALTRLSATANSRRLSRRDQNNPRGGARSATRAAEVTAPGTARPGLWCAVTTFSTAAGVYRNMEAEAVGKRSSDFDAFVSAESRSLLRLAWVITGGDWHRAQDLVQETLARMWLRWDRVAAVERPADYARRSLINANVSAARRRGFRLVSLSRGLHDFPHHEAQGERDVDDRVALVASVARLPTGQRNVIALRYFLDQTEHSTAAVLHCSVGTVKSQHARAIAALRLDPALTGIFRQSSQETR